MLGTTIKDRFRPTVEALEAIGDWQLPETLQRSPEAQQRIERLASRNGYIHHIPMAWLLLALKLPNCALRLGILLWFYHGMRPHEPVVISRSKLSLAGLAPRTGHKAVQLLARAGLIVVDHNPPKAPRVRLIKLGGPVPLPKHRQKHKG